jgi:hypothetical protein
LGRRNNGSAIQQCDTRSSNPVYPPGSNSITRHCLLAAPNLPAPPWRFLHQRDALIVLRRNASRRKPGWARANHNDFEIETGLSHLSSPPSPLHKGPGNFGNEVAHRS